MSNENRVWIFHRINKTRTGETFTIITKLQNGSKKFSEFTEEVLLFTNSKLQTEYFNTRRILQQLKKL